MITLNKQFKVVDEKKRAYYDISLIINKKGKLIVIDNSESAYHDFIDGDTETIIPMIIKVKC